MACCCNPVPVIVVTAINSDSTTGITTLTLSNALPASGRFDLKFNICGCVNICSCATYPVNFQYEATTYSNIYDNNLNRVQIGQLTKQILCYKCAHFYASVSPAGNIISKDCLKPGIYTGPTTSNNTQVSSNASTPAA